MREKLKKLKNSKGYVSVETIICAGLVIGIGVVAFMAFQGKANDITGNALNKVDTAMNSAVVNPAP